MTANLFYTLFKTNTKWYSAWWWPVSYSVDMTPPFFRPHKPQKSTEYLQNFFPNQVGMDIGKL